MDLNINASAMRLKTVRSEYESACDKASALLGTLVRLRERRRTLHVDPSDASVMITCIRDLERTEAETEAAERDRDNLGKLVEDLKRAHERAERDHKLWTHRQNEPAAKEALAESLAKLKEWCASHAEVQRTMQAAGLVTYGQGYSQAFTQLLSDHGLLAAFGK